ncbi:MAG: Uncharacterised protein [SAR116 cluster bacterium]|nr:MAG: Uncharacterised protein [SAR116 cluster bacterium]
MVVKAGAAGDITRRAGQTAQQMCQHFLAAGLANRSGDAGQPAACRAMRGATGNAQIIKCGADIINHQLGQGTAGIRRGHKGGGGPLSGGSSDEIMAIGLCPRQGNKQGTVAAFAAVDLDRCDHG